MDINHVEIRVVIPQEAIDKVIADEMVLKKCMEAQLELQKLVTVVTAASQTVAKTEVAGRTVATNAITEVDNALLLMDTNPDASEDQLWELIFMAANNMKKYMESAVTMVKKEEEKVRVQAREAARRGGLARAALAEARNKLIGMGINNYDPRIMPIYMWNDAVSVAWLMVHESKGSGIIDVMQILIYDLELAMQKMKEASSFAALAMQKMKEASSFAAHVAHKANNMYNTSHQELIKKAADMVKDVGTEIILITIMKIEVVNDMYKAVDSLNLAIKSLAEMRSSKEAAVSTTEADVQMTEVNAQMPNTGEEYTWVANVQNPNKRMRLRGGKRKSKRSRRGKKQIKKTKKYKKRSNKKRSNKK